MLIDITGIVLTPGNGGRDCLGNGQHTDKNDDPIEWCCDECDYAVFVMTLLCRISPARVARKHSARARRLTRTPFDKRQESSYTD
jgi:hypothetical protein